MEAPTFDINTVPEKDRERVEKLIPDPAWADSYVHRNIEGWYDFDLFDYAVAEQENLILTGETGSSKSTAFRAYAALRGLPFALVESNASMDIQSVIGRTTVAHVDGLAVDEFVDGEMTLVVRYGGVLLIDEIDMTHPRVTAGFHQLLAGTRRMSVIENGETVIAAYPSLFAAARNGRAYQGTTRMSEALLNRYAMPFDWNYERSVEEQLVTSGRLLDLAYGIRNTPEIRTPTSTNALMEYERHATKLDMAAANYFLLRRYPMEERGPVKLALEAEGAAIAAELGVAHAALVNA